jgi:hypothetical protein
MTYVCVFYRTHRLLSTDLDTGNDIYYPLLFGNNISQLPLVRLGCMEELVSQIISSLFSNYRNRAANNMDRTPEYESCWIATNHTVLLTN